MEQQVDVLDLTRKLGREPNIGTALHILQWELGDLAKLLTYEKWHPEAAIGYRADAKHALADLLFQAEVVAQLLGTTSQEAFAFGVEVVKERIEEIKMKEGRFRHYVGDQKDG